jgi:hypothetical protein
LTIIFLFFIANSCFAMKTGKERPAYHAAPAKKVTALKLFCAKIPFGEGSNLTEDEFEHPTVLQQVLKPYPVSSFQLFHLLANAGQDGPVTTQAIVKTNFTYQFIYNLLYPKHFFR